MKISTWKLAGVLLASISMICAGPAWSAGASAPNKNVKSVAKHKAKVTAKARGKVKAKAKTRVRAKSRAATTVGSSMVVSAVAASVAVAAPVAREVQTGYNPITPAVNPYLAYQQPMTPVNPWDNVRVVKDNLKAALPSLPEGSLLPSIKKVYPTGEKPLVVVNFKCPTEMIGVTPLPTKFLHDMVDAGMGAVNATNLLSFNLQQVCQ